MGYFKNIEVEQQAAIDDITAFWKSHEGRVPDYLLKMVINDDDFWPKVRDRWMAEELAPRPASTHVALQPARRHRRNPKRSIRQFVGWTMLNVAIVVGGIVVGVNL